MKQVNTPAIVKAQPSHNTTDLLIDRVKATPHQVLFAIPAGEGWSDITAQQFLTAVTQLAKGFVAADIQPGDKVGFICKTKYEWTLVDFALWFAGAVMVPIYDTSSPSQIQWILEDSEAVALITETETHFARFDEVGHDLPRIKTVLRLDEGALSTAAKAGVDIPDEEIERRRNLAQGSDIATLIYTSGSTGRPKGVVLTHSNFVETSRNSVEALSIMLVGGASTLLFITLAHVFARFISVLCIDGGIRVGHQADTTQLLPALKSFRPSFLLAVPRVFEKVYNASEQKAEGEGKGKIFRAAVKVAVEHSRAVERGSVPLGLRIKFRIFDLLVFSKLREALGGQVKYAVSGSAPLGETLGHFYHSLGIKILEGYGLTETTAPLTVNLPQNFKIGTVGPPLPGVSIRIAEDGEILAQGVDIFDRYWNNEEATKEAFTEDGYFKTGDVGSFDSEGRLIITGRKKEIIVTAGGKNVAPAFLEDPIRANPIISQVTVVGDQKPFISALITLDMEMLPTWLKNKGLNPDMSLGQASKDPTVLAEIQKAVDAANTRVSRAESIRKFTVLPVEYTEESGHLTPKMSTKRNIILRDFASDIEALYAGTAPHTEGMSIQH
ncbi:long-chain fatty acid--CoA ligase [Lysinibacter sp. HNR]|uniref:AMP-dependent synthetase/ligase n=1 Tax=Lysinibacter sp. HNR TaxID=3031408 RepID=UPI00243613C4|nr:long-chain fatty acid--CoA ligase [Lysinibacter sp. HNR]WGD36483.1 long-chain fatty acid--CoA ligase [Lysinibacter sp. HNR]